MEAFGRIQWTRKEMENMERTNIPDPPGFSELSKQDQIRYLQSLWDRISENPEDVPVLESHLELAEERLAVYRQDPSKARPAHEMLNRLTERW